MSEEKVNPLLSAALAYASMGMPVFPCAPCRKTPIPDRGFLDATTDEKQIRSWWRANPRANVAVPTGQTSGLVVIDIDPRNGGEVGLDVLQTEHGQLGETAESQTGGGGRHLFYRHPGGVIPCTQSELGAGIDVKGDGGYVVLPPSVHPDGGSYIWELSSDIADVLPAECPPWLLDILHRENEASTGGFASDLADGNTIPEGLRNKALASLAGGMRRMGMGRDEILAALQSTNQSRCKPPIPDQEVERIAESIARYEPDAISVALVEDHYEQMYGAKPQGTGDSSGDDPGPIPDELLRVPGFVSELMDHCVATAPYPNQVMAFSGALTLQAFLAGRKVRDPGDNRTNLYLLGLAHSSAGKDWPRKLNTALLWKAGIGHCIGDKFASGEGIQDALFINPSMLFQTDEIDGMLQSISKSRDARYENIMGTLLTLYTSSATVFPMRRKAGKEDPGAIDQPCLTIFGTAIPTHYYEALSQRMLTNGFFARMIVLEAGKRGTGQEPTIRETPDRIVAVAKWWAQYNPGGERANLEQWHPVPKIVEHTPSAKGLLVDVRQEAEAEYSKAEDRGDEVSTTVWGRVSENVRKLALLYAVSENHLKPVIGDAAVEWASRFMMHQTRRMLFMAREHVSTNEHDGRCKELLRVVRKWRDKHGNEWMPFWKINRALPWSDRDHEEVRITLLNQVMIEYTERKTGGTPQRLYRIL